MSALSKKEQELVHRLKASGRRIDTKQLNAPFRFMIRPFTTSGTPSLEFASWFEDLVFDAIRGIDFESPITGIVIFPTIFDSRIGKPPKDYL